MLGGGVTAAAAAAGVVRLLADEVEMDRATREVELADHACFEVAAVLLGKFFFAVTKQLDAEGPRAGLSRVVHAEAFATDSSRRVALGQKTEHLVELRGRQL